MKGNTAMHACAQEGACRGGDGIRLPCETHSNPLGDALRLGVCGWCEHACSRALTCGPGQHTVRAVRAERERSPPPDARGGVHAREPEHGAVGPHEIGWREESLCSHTGWR
jgi:hypothetical protein